MVDTTPENLLEAFWQQYRAGLPPAEREQQSSRPPAWGFGDGAAMADELGMLVRKGIKTATCSLLWEYEVTGEPPPQVGSQSIILNGLGHPLCIIETVEVTIRPYNEVPADFAHDEGEGDRTLESWRDGHWRYFSRLCDTLGLKPGPAMPLVCERFRLIFAPELT